MNSCVHLTIALVVAAVQHHCLVGAGCTNEYEGDEKQLLESFKYFIVEAASQPLEELQCLVFEESIIWDPIYHVDYAIGYMKNGTVKRDKGANVYVNRGKAIGIMYSDLTEATRRWPYSVIFGNERSCLVIGHRDKKGFTGKYYVIRNVDAQREDYEPCIEKLKQCSDVMFSNEGQDCSEVIKLMK